MPRLPLNPNQLELFAKPIKQNWVQHQMSTNEGIRDFFDVIRRAIERREPDIVRNMVRNQTSPASVLETLAKNASFGLEKIAKSLQLKKLLEAKKMSDQNKYGDKNTILKDLFDRYPKEFKVDSHLDGKYVGVTHKPTNFKIHAPRNLIPIGIEHASSNEKSFRRS